MPGAGQPGSQFPREGARPGRGPADPSLAPPSVGGRGQHPHFTAEDTEAQSAALAPAGTSPVPTSPVPRALLDPVGETEVNQSHPGVRTPRGHRNLCLAERCRPGPGKESSSLGTGTLEGHREPGRGLPGRGVSRAVSGLGQGVGRLGLADGRTKGAWESLPCPSHLATGCPPSWPWHRSCSGPAP